MKITHPWVASERDERTTPPWKENQRNPEAFFLTRTHKKKWPRPALAQAWGLGGHRRRKKETEGIPLSDMQTLEGMGSTSGTHTKRPPPASPNMLRPKKRPWKRGREIKHCKWGSQPNTNHLILSSNTNNQQALAQTPGRKDKCSV